ncbi:MAG: N-acetylneuraminate synthase family protein [Oligoflexia bacterium]|nr:N-acetylneuraminate synthase family protein [Oligoflexia bacterium]
MEITYIAEIGNNHNGNIDVAKKMAEAAIAAGADYIKFQIYKTDQFIEKNGQFYDEFSQEQLSYDEFKALKRYVESLGGKFLATPFDIDSLEFIAGLDVDAIKIASGDMNNWPLLEKLLQYKKKIFISVGGWSINEIDEIVSFLDKKEARFSILHCIISYPSQFEELNLRFIPFLEKKYQKEIGFSDHSLGIEGSLAAIALGATIIEKHFTIDKSLPGGDNSMSIEPDEFKRLKFEGDNIALALGSENKCLSENEMATKKIISRFFYASRDISAGAVVSPIDLVALRGENSLNGIPVEQYYNLIGKRTKVLVSKHSLINSSFFE